MVKALGWNSWKGFWILGDGLTCSTEPGVDGSLFGLVWAVGTPGKTEPVLVNTGPGQFGYRPWSYYPEIPIISC